MWALTVACGAMFYKNLRFYPPVSIVKAVSRLELLLYSEQEINLSLFSPFPGTQIMSRTGLENRVLADTLRVRLTVTGIICLKESQHLIFTIIAINGTAMHIDKLWVFSQYDIHHTVTSTNHTVLYQQKVHFKTE